MNSWERKYYSGPGGRPALFYVLFGTFGDMPPMSRGSYHSTGIPAGFDLMSYARSTQREVLEGFCEGYLWEELEKHHPQLAQATRQAESCFILRGEIEDQPDLNYFRDAIGIMTYLADSGGISIFDPHMFKWWGLDEWKSEVFADHEPYPRHHVVTLVSDTSEGQWLHTRGMRKFGRPDLSMCNVTPAMRQDVLDMFNRLIEFQAFGGIIEEGKPITMKGTPEGLMCHHAGSLDDPDFNNVHVEIGIA